MIKIKYTLDGYKIRANGWVQDSSDFDHLWWFCSAFDKESPNFEAILKKINLYVTPDSLKESLKNVMQSSEQKYNYFQIVGNHKGGTSRKTSTVCNAIGQAAVNGQKRPFIGDWPADNFLRWALLLGFVQYLMDSDEYQISKLGKTFVRETDAEKRNKIVSAALKNYPPVRRIVKLLKDNPNGLTKFEIGEKLGCVGEKGFTNIGQQLFEEMYFSADCNVKKSLMSNKEGSSDKYARQICSWLQKLKYVAVKKTTDKNKAPLNIYYLTAFGLDFARQIEISKTVNVQFSMLSMAASNKETIMKRRAMILYFAQEKQICSLKEINEKLLQQSITSSVYELEDDVLSMHRCGIDIQIDSGMIRLKNYIDGLDIPDKIYMEKSTIIEKIKNYLRPKLKHVNHDLLKLIDFSYGGKESYEWFENYTFKVFSCFCSNAQWLGGSSRPDVIAEYGNLGLIIDSKAYKEGFSADKSMKDEMIRYVNEADQKPENIVSKWWEKFSPNVSHFAFQYVSSSFSKEIGRQLNDISEHSYSKEKGSAISAQNLLLLAEKALSTPINPSIFEINDEIQPGKHF